MAGRGEDILQDPSVATDDAPGPGEALDPAALVARMEGDEELAREIAALFLATVPATLEALREAAGRGDLPSVRGSAHAVKGASANLGAVAVSRHAGAVEEAARIGRPAEVAAAMPGLFEAFAAAERGLRRFLDGTAGSGAGAAEARRVA